MKRRLAVAAVLLVGSVGDAFADDQRAQVNYMLHCQGCHLPDGTGIRGRVPQLKGLVGNFLRTEDGRAYVIEVPGVATSRLGDAELAAVVNWMLTNFSRSELPTPFRPYTAEEVALLRKNPEPDPDARRARIFRLLKAS